MTIEADARNLAKWLNEEQAAPIDRQTLARILAHLQTPQEPFGYFRPEPFGWTDCAQGDEGAVALYDKPQATEEHKVILQRCRDLAMEWTLKGRIPECGPFGEIAQDLDWLCAQAK